MTTTGEGPKDPKDAARAGRHGRPGWRLLGWISIGTAAVLVAGSLTAYGFYRNLSGNIRQHEVRGALGDDRPAKAGGAENILLIGSDTRAGENASFGGTRDGARSDTLILVHLSPGRDHATLVSFPRDSLVEIPECRTPNGTMARPRVGMLNEAFDIGGPACSWRTIESLTGIHIDHFVQIDFAGFRDMVDALGGVQVCLPEPVNDPKAKLTLPAGRHVVDGEQALGYVRMRHSIGDGSDLQRIERQQRFLAAVVKKATSTRLLFEPGRLYGFLDAATRSVTTDPGLSLPDLRRIAESVQNMETGEVTFATVPTHPAPADPNRLRWTQPAADQLFTAIQRDRPLSSPGGDTATDAGVGSDTPAMPASQVRVRVLNGTGISGLAGRTADELRGHGFQVVDVGNTRDPAAETLIRYRPDAGAQATAVARAVPGARAVEHASAPGAVELVIGDNWQGVAPSQPRTGPGTGQGAGQGEGPGRPSPADTMTAADDICAAPGAGPR